MSAKQFNDQIVEFLDNSSSPMTMESIAENFGVSQYRIGRALDELIVGGKIVKIVPQNKNNGRVYYTTKTGYGDKIIIGDKNSQCDLNVKKIIAQETVNAKDNYKDLSEKIEHIDKNVNGIYVNIISIMSIFVAIFALITVNANMVFELTTENMNNIFWGIIKINIFVVICIIALLIGVRVIIINPLLGKKKKR